MAKQHKKIRPTGGKVRGVPRKGRRGAFSAVQQRTAAVGRGCPTAQQHIGVICIPYGIGQGDEAGVKPRARCRTATAENSDRQGFPSFSAMAAIIAPA